ncbi:MAG: hypothetical protein K2N05_07540 [Muribaculaceae bacterium]|nr:hypothetical protein [Muribaculaceae bacterium]
MKRLFYFTAAGAMALVMGACGGTGRKSLENDSLKLVDSIRVADSIQKADSISKVLADSIARADSIAKADSITKAKAKDLEANRDKSIDRDLKMAEEEGKLAKKIFESGEFLSSAERHADASVEIIRKLKKKQDKMSPKQLAKFKKLSKGII